jgi:hypothetical protein
MVISEACPEIAIVSADYCKLYVFVEGSIVCAPLRPAGGRHSAHLRPQAACCQPPDSEEDGSWTTPSAARPLTALPDTRRELGEVSAEAPCRELNGSGLNGVEQRLLIQAPTEHPHRITSTLYQKQRSRSPRERAATCLDDAFSKQSSALRRL